MRSKTLGIASIATLSLLFISGCSTTQSAESRQAAGEAAESTAGESPAPTESASSSDSSTAAQPTEEDMPFVALPSTGCTDAANWMSCVFQQGNVAITDITMPGSHDSGTWGVNSESEYAWNCGSVPPSIPISIAGKWARTQEGDLGKQAANGARYFDIRTFFPRRSTAPIMTCHSYTGASLMDTLGHKSEFIKFAKSHPEEVFILDMQQFFADNKDDSSAARKKQIADWLKTELGDVMYSRTTNDQRLSNVTLSDIRKSGKNVIVLGRDDYAAEDLNMWPRAGNLYSEWQDDSEAAKQYWNSEYVAAASALADRELGALSRAPSQGTVNVLNYIFDSNCPDWSGACPSYALRAGIVPETIANLNPRLLGLCMRLHKQPKAAIVMRDVSNTGNTKCIWDLNDKKKD